MFDLTLAQVSHPDRERDLATELERRRLVRDLASHVAAVEPERVASRAAARTTPARAGTSGR